MWAKADSWVWTMKPLVANETVRVFRCPASLDRLGENAKIGEAVDEVLNRQGDEQKAHDADEDADAGWGQERGRRRPSSRGQGSRQQR